MKAPYLVSKRYDGGHDVEDYFQLQLFFFCHLRFFEVDTFHGTPVFFLWLWPDFIFIEYFSSFKILQKMGCCFLCLQLIN